MQSAGTNEKATVHLSHLERPVVVVMTSVTEGGIVFGWTEQDELQAVVAPVLVEARRVVRARLFERMRTGSVH